jgi:tRNA G46 methylase TrmB
MSDGASSFSATRNPGAFSIGVEKHVTTLGKTHAKFDSQETKYVGPKD